MSWPQKWQCATMAGMKTLLVLGAFVLTVGLHPFGAHADVVAPAPGEIPCFAKAVGDSCTDDVTGNAGKCQHSSCTYTHRNGTYSQDCVRCIPGDTNGDKDSGCSMGGSHLLSKRFGPWLLAGAFASLCLFSRRRRRSSRPTDKAPPARDA